MLGALGIACDPVEADGDLGSHDILVVGKGALTVDGPGPDVSRVRGGLKVILFEQTGDVLEKRFGFRVAEYGLRQLFPRVPDHPLLEGLDVEGLRDWRGEATILPPRLTYTIGAAYRQSTPVVKWCDLDVPRVWRCGYRGNVASVLIEKPAKGDFLPILDGGYSLQYSPLMEYREGKGLVVFCQVDVNGRTEIEPAAQLLAQNLIRYVAAWRPAAIRTALYVGEPAGKRHLEISGIPFVSYVGGELVPDQVLIVRPGGGPVLARNRAAVADFLKGGGHLLALGLDEPEARSFLPFPIGMRNAEHIAAFFEPPGRDSPFSGIGPADVHNRDPRRLPLAASGTTVVGDGILARRGRRTSSSARSCPIQSPAPRERSPPSSSTAMTRSREGRAHLLTLGTASESGMQFGQTVKAGEVGKTYTFAVFAKPIGAPVSVYLEIASPSGARDRAVKGDRTLLAADEWTEPHVTFKVERPSPQGWFASITGGRDGDRLRVDRFRINEGDYVPASVSAKAGQAPSAGKITFTNPGFETGTRPWSFTCGEQYNLRRTYRRASFVLARLLANTGVAAPTPLLDRFHTPVNAGGSERRWLGTFYLDQPEEWDDPYRFFNW